MDKFPLLKSINSPADLKKIPRNQLKSVCSELREFIITKIEKSGGHLASTLGVVELSVALHYLYDSPNDKLVWDVGHQAYAHKILTGRRDELDTIRQFGGISGFLKRDENQHDAFGAGHASTAVSAAFGLSSARDILGENHNVVAILGDGALTGGMAYEALNNVGTTKTQFLTILNDNEMSISPNVGGISHYLTRLVTNPKWNRLRNDVWDFSGKLPKSGFLRRGLRKVEESLKTLLTPGVLFEELGLRYFGPIDGNDLDELLKTLENIKRIKTPIVLHILTKKGKGLTDAEENPVQYHGIAPAKTTGETEEKIETPYLKVLGDSLIKQAQKNNKLVAITPAMCTGSGLQDFAKQFPKRFFDVGIAEEHAVTFAGGLAAEGLRPVLAIYSTFLQRGFDQVLHDIALQKLPVIFAIDRAGLVGEDGPTHHGAFDLSFLSQIPNLIVSAPKDGDELMDLLETAIHSEFPFAIRYPKDDCIAWNPEKTPQKIEIGKWEMLRTGENLAILGVGAMAEVAMQTANLLAKSGVSATVVNCRFVSPLDETMLAELDEKFSQIVTIEENVRRGGFGERVHSLCQSAKVEIISLPDDFVTHGKRQKLLEICGLEAKKIAEKIG